MKAENLKTGEELQSYFFKRIGKFLESENRRMIGWGETNIAIVGLPDAAVKESRDRVSTAMTNSPFKFPMGRSSTTAFAPLLTRVYFSITRYVRRETAPLV